MQGMYHPTRPLSVAHGARLARAEAMWRAAEAPPPRAASPRGTAATVVRIPTLVPAGRLQSPSMQSLSSALQSEQSMQLSGPPPGLDGWHSVSRAPTAGSSRAAGGDTGTSAFAAGYRFGFEVCTCLCVCVCVCACVCVCVCARLRVYNN